MLSRAILAIIVGVVTAIVVAVIGLILVKIGLEQIGSFIKGISGLIGLLAGLWYFVTGQTPNRAV